MPIRSRTTSNGAEAYVDIRVGSQHTIHQTKVSQAAVAAHQDADGYLPAGLPLKADGTPVAATEVPDRVVGPEPVKLYAGETVFVNTIHSGGLNQDAIEDNLNRAMTADEVKLPAGFQLF